ncbi:glutamate cyclase domain-containing protein [Deltaproteobacteria bacterium TL4]
MSEIEKILLMRDQRGIASKVSKELPLHNLSEIAKKLSSKKGKVLIATGFMINQKQETDGPPGAIFLGRGLHKLGFDVIFLSNHDCREMLKTIVEFNSVFIDFPVFDLNESIPFSNEILHRYTPTCLIAIECLGLGKSGRYHTSRGIDITAVTPKIDTLFNSAKETQIYTVGIGDGGNEIGFGNIETDTLTGICFDPSTVKTSALIVSSVSNWGAYGLIAELSLIKNENLLPRVEEEERVLKHLVKMGAVDGMSGKNTVQVDGLNLEENSRCLTELHRQLEALRRSSTNSVQK